jgi:hypothetical protein
MVCTTHNLLKLHAVRNWSKTGHPHRLGHKASECLRPGFVLIRKQAATREFWKSLRSEIKAVSSR